MLLRTTKAIALEYVVPVGHSCQGYPLTIVEVRRILLEHLESASTALATQTPEVKR